MLTFQGHWYLEQPTKGSAYRCLHFTTKEVDPVFHKASEAAGVAFAEISVRIEIALITYSRMKFKAFIIHCFLKRLTESYYNNCPEYFLTAVHLHANKRVA